MSDFALREKIGELWKKHISQTVNCATKEKARLIAKIALKQIHQLNMHDAYFNDAFDVIHFAEQSKSAVILKDQLISLVRNILKIQQIQGETEQTSKRSTLDSRSITSNSSTQTKRSNHELQLKLLATKQLKQFQSSKTFEKKEARKFVDQLIKQCGNNFPLVHFNRWFQETDCTKRGSLDIEQMYKLVVRVASGECGQVEDIVNKEKQRLQKMIKSAYAPALIQKNIDRIWNSFDQDRNGVLDQNEALAFVDMVMKSLNIKKGYSKADFVQWFRQLDEDHSGTLDKEEMTRFITRVAKNQMFEIKDLSVFENQIEEGSHHIRKLVGMYKNNGLDYLAICDLTRKIFRCFDLSNCRELGKIEMKCLLEALSNEMNIINTNLNIQTFQKWFDQIDLDGSQNISLQELIQAFCNIFKVARPREKWLTKSNQVLPQGLVKKNDEMIRTSLRKFAAVTPTAASSQ